MNEHNSTPGEPVQPRFSPLEGVRVIDLCSNIAGPYATMILAQLGADVIKIEPPEGDDARRYANQVAGQSLVHHLMGAGKRSVVFDVKKADGLRVALQLIDTADVVIQSMRPGVAERIGLGREALTARNPYLLYYDISAYGPGDTGRRMPGYDPLVQAFSGIMDMTGHDGTPPTRCAPSVIDLGTGQWVAMGVLAATLAGARGAAPLAMQTALVDTAFSLVAYQATEAKMSGKRPARAGSGNPIAAPYQCFQASDGYLLIAAPSQRLWESLLKAIEAPALATEDRFATVDARSKHRAELEVELTRILAQHSVAHWIERIEAERVPVGRVSGLEEAVASPIADERGTFLPSRDVPLVRLPLLVDDQPLAWRRPSPDLGEHTHEVLSALGYEDNDVELLSSSGAVVIP